MEKKVLARCYCRKLKNNHKKYLVLVEYPNSSGYSTGDNAAPSVSSPSSHTVTARGELYKNECKFQQNCAPSQVISLDDLFYVDTTHRKRPQFGLILITDSASYAFALESADEQLWLQDNLRSVVYRNRREKLYPTIICAFDSSVKFKALPCTESSNINHANFRAPTGLTSCRFLLTHETIMLVTSSVNDPNYVIHYHFIRGYSSRDDGRLSLNLGRASPLGECEVVIQLADKMESSYAHKQCIQISSQCKDHSSVQRSRSTRSVIQSRIITRRNSGMAASVIHEVGQQPADVNSLRAKRLSSASLSSNHPAIPIVFSPTLASSFASPHQSNHGQPYQRSSGILPGTTTSNTTSSPASGSSFGSSSIGSNMLSEPSPFSSLQKRMSSSFAHHLPLGSSSVTSSSGGAWRPTYLCKTDGVEEGSTIEATVCATDQGELFSTGETIICANVNDSSAGVADECGIRPTTLGSQTPSYGLLPSFPSKQPFMHNRSSLLVDRKHAMSSSSGGGRYSVGFGRQRSSYQSGIESCTSSSSQAGLCDHYVPLSPGEFMDDHVLLSAGTDGPPGSDNHYVLMSPSSASDTSSVPDSRPAGTHRGGGLGGNYTVLQSSRAIPGQSGLFSQPSQTGVDRVASYLGNKVLDEHSHYYGSEFYKRAYSLGNRPLLRSLCAEPTVLEATDPSAPGESAGAEMVEIRSLPCSASVDPMMVTTVMSSNNTVEGAGGLKGAGTMHSSSTSGSLSAAVAKPSNHHAATGQYCSSREKNDERAASKSDDAGATSVVAPPGGAASLSGHRDDAQLFMEVNYVDRPRTSSDSRAQRPKSHSVFPPIGSLFRLVRDATMGSCGVHSATTYSSRRMSHQGGGGGTSSSLSTQPLQANNAKPANLLRRTTTLSGSKPTSSLSFEVPGQEGVASPSGTSSSICSVPSSGLQSVSKQASVTSSCRDPTADVSAFSPIVDISHSSTEVGLLSDAAVACSLAIPLPTTEDSGVDYMEAPSSSASYSSSTDPASQSSANGNYSLHQHHSLHHHHHHHHHEIPCHRHSEPPSTHVL